MCVCVFIHVGPCVLYLNLHVISLFEGNKHICCVRVPYVTRA